MASNIRHSSNSQLWLTPPHVVTRIHDVFGGPPDFDPASSPEANIFMEAKLIMTEEEDSLVTPWPVHDQSSVWLNPPGGLHPTTSKSMQGLFWARLMKHRRRVGHAMFMCFNLNILQVSQNFADRGIVTFPLVILRKRLKFWHFNEHGHLLEGERPSHPNAIVYIPGQMDYTGELHEAFEDLGDCVWPRFA